MAMGWVDLGIIRWRGKGCKRNPVVSKELGEGGNEEDHGRREAEGSNRGTSEGGGVIGGATIG